ncbi:MAG: hypothetical protein ACKVOE_00010 [Rickettsiales bacterium]
MSNGQPFKPELAEAFETKARHTHHTRENIQAFDQQVWKLFELQYSQTSARANGLQSEVTEADIKLAEKRVVGAAVSLGDNAKHAQTWVGYVRGAGGLAANNDHHNGVSPSEQSAYKHYVNEINHKESNGAGVFIDRIIPHEEFVAARSAQAWAAYEKSHPRPAPETTQDHREHEQRTPRPVRSAPPVVADQGNTDRDPAPTGQARPPAIPPVIEGMPGSPQWQQEQADRPLTTSVPESKVRPQAIPPVIEGMPGSPQWQQEQADRPLTTSVPKPAVTNTADDLKIAMNVVSNATHNKATKEQAAKIEGMLGTRGNGNGVVEQNEGTAALNKLMGMTATEDGRKKLHELVEDLKKSGAVAYVQAGPNDNTPQGATVSGVANAKHDPKGR